VSPDVAAQLAERHAAEDVERAVAVAARRAVRNPAGFVVMALRGGWDLASERQPASASGRTHVAGQDAADQAAPAQAIQERAKAAGWCQAISAALADAQLREALQQVTTPAPGVGRRSLPLARAQLVAWAIHVARCQPSLPLAEALSVALANGVRPVEPTDDAIPDPPATAAGVADLTARLRACLPDLQPAKEVTHAR
jgi:hypothetical protein